MQTLPSIAFVLLFALTVRFSEAVCNCGCLECNKHLKVLSSPLNPVKIILKKEAYCPKSIGGYTIERPVRTKQQPPPLYSYGYNIQALNLAKPCRTNQLRSLGYSVETPIIYKDSRSYLSGLVAQPDRIVYEVSPDFISQDEPDSSQINIQPIAALEDELNDEEGQLYFQAPSLVNNCPCNKRYIRVDPNSFIAYRSKRSLYPGAKSRFMQALLRPKRQSLPQLFQDTFYKLKNLGKDRDAGNADNCISKSDQYGSSEDDQEVLLKPMNINALVPEDTAIYILNTPIRFLARAKQLKDYIFPIVECLPRVFRNTNKYVHSFLRDLNMKRHRFMGNFVHDLDLVHEIPEPMYEPVYPKRIRRDVEYAKAHENLDDEIKRTPRQDAGEPPSPRIVTDEKGCVFVELNGVKKPILEDQKLSKEAGVHKITSIDDLDVKDKISSIIRLAKKMSDVQPDASKSQGSVVVVKAAISRVLDKIQGLINVNINQDIDIFDHVRKVKALKTGIAREWYCQLNNHQFNDIRMKIKLLNDIKTLQNMKNDTFQRIVKRLQSEDDFNTELELDSLLQLDHLQTVIDRIVDELGSKIQFRSRFDLKSELNFVQDLVNVKLIPEKSPTEIGRTIRAVRDQVLEKQIHELESLKTILHDNDERILSKEMAVIQHGGHLDAQKQRLIGELDGLRADQGSKLRSIVNLQRQMDVLAKSHEFSKVEPASETKQVEGPKIEVEGQKTEVEGPKMEVEGPKMEAPQKHQNRLDSGEEDVKILHRDSENPKIQSSKPKNVLFPVFKFPSRSVSNIIVRDKSPVPLVSNGYVLTAYKDSDE